MKRLRLVDSTRVICVLDKFNESDLVSLVQSHFALGFHLPKLSLNNAIQMSGNVLHQCLFFCVQYHAEKFTQKNFLTLDTK